MPAKDDIKLRPEKLGISERDIMFLLVFRELYKQSASTSEIHEVVRSDLRTISRGRSRSYLYAIMNQMESDGWIQNYQTDFKSNKKYYTITSSGYLKLSQYRESYLESITRLKNIAEFFAYQITGTGSCESIDISPEHRKMFGRLINVRHLIRYLFLKILTEPDHRRETGKNIWNILKDRYHWQPAQGYFYELAREMEADYGYVQGSWTTPRRSQYVYRLTDEGIQAIEKEGETALFYIRQLQNYCIFMMNLFPEFQETQSEV